MSDLPHLLAPVLAPQPVPGALDAIAQRGRPDRAQLIALGEIFDGYDGIGHSFRLWTMDFRL